MSCCLYRSKKIMGAPPRRDRDACQPPACHLHLHCGSYNAEIMLVVERKINNCSFESFPNGLNDKEPPASQSPGAEVYLIYRIPRGLVWGCVCVCVKCTRWISMKAPDLIEMGIK